MFCVLFCFHTKRAEVCRSAVGSGSFKQPGGVIWAYMGGYSKWRRNSDTYEPEVSFPRLLWCIYQDGPRINVLMEEGFLVCFVP